MLTHTLWETCSWGVRDRNRSTFLDVSECWPCREPEARERLARGGAKRNPWTLARPPPPDHRALEGREKCLALLCVPLLHVEGTLLALLPERRGYEADLSVAHPVVLARSSLHHRLTFSQASGSPRLLNGIAISVD